MFSDNVWALEKYARALNKPFIYGKTSHTERTQILAAFKRGRGFNTVFLSKVCCWVCSVLAMLHLGCFLMMQVQCYATGGIILHGKIPVCLASCVWLLRPCEVVAATQAHQE